MARARSVSGSRRSVAGLGAGIGLTVRDGSRVTNSEDPAAELLYPSYPWPSVRVSVPAPLSLVEDRRLFSPLATGVPLTVGGSSARPVVRPQARGRFPDYRLQFDAPTRVVVCVRRKQRREVLSALGKLGGRHRRPRRNSFSSWEC